MFVENSSLIANLYALPGREMFSGTGFVDDGPAQIEAVTFTGTNLPVPDTGSTLALMGMGLLGIFVYARRVNASASDVSRSSATSQS